VIAASRVSTGQADVAIGIELVAIAAVIVGGTSPAGGEGAIWRSIVGVLLLALISNGFNLVKINSFYLPIVQGLIILFAIAADSWAHGRVRFHRTKRRPGAIGPSGRDVADPAKVLVETPGVEERGAPR
jgi:ribose transport system permease protein